MRKQREEEDRLREEAEAKLARNMRFATKAILRFTYSDVEDKFVEMMSEAYSWMSGGADARRRAKQAIVQIQRRWRRKLTLRAAREFRMSKMQQLFHVDAALGGEDSVLKIQAHIRSNLTRIRLRRGLDLIVQSDFLVGSKRQMTRGRCAIELYVECYRDFLKSLDDKEVFSRVGTELFVHELLSFQEPWNHERAQKRARLFGTDADEDVKSPSAPQFHPQPGILQEVLPSP